MIGIVATDCTGGIGRDGKIPWYLSSDLNRFKAITTFCESSDRQNVIIMGRKTWESIGRLLPGRINIVMSRSLNDHYFGGDCLAKNKQDVLDYLELNGSKINKVFIIGGKQIYDLFYNDIQTLELTILQKDYKCDTKLDLKKIYGDFKLMRVEPQENYTNLTMDRAQKRPCKK